MFLFSAPLVFPCLGGKVAQYGVGKKKVSFMEGGGGSIPFMISVSRFTLLEKKKMKQVYWKQMLTLCRFVEDGKSSLSRCSCKGVLMAVKVPVMGLPAVRGQQKLHETQNEVSL